MNLMPDFHFIRTVQAPDHVVLDKNTNLYRLSSAAFGPSRHDKRLSGDLEQVLADDGLERLTLYPAVDRAVAAAAITVGQFRKLSCDVDHDPNYSNWYHGAATGTKKNSIRKKLLDVAKMVVPIDQEAAKQFRSKTLNSTEEEAHIF